MVEKHRLTKKTKKTSHFGAATESNSNQFGAARREQVGISSQWNRSANTLKTKETPSHYTKPKLVGEIKIEHETETLAQLGKYCITSSHVGQNQRKYPP